MGQAKKRKTVHESFLDAARQGDFDGLRFYAGEGAALETRDSRGRTALHIAAERGLTRTMDVLIELGAEVDARDRQNETPLMLAARQQSGLSVAQKLIDAGADITLRNKKGETAFTLGTEDSAAKSVLRRAWLDALERNPPEIVVETAQVIHIRKPISLKPAAPPQ